jgi:hypothetical protein
MESVAVIRPTAAARAEVLIAALVAATAALVVHAFSPPGGDAAAHIYRTWLLEQGVTVWDNLWFTGHYPLAGYSLLYYPPAAVVGNVPLVVASVVAAAALFAAICFDLWGDAARWPVRAFAVAASIPLFTGTYSYAVGFACGLGALRLLQLRRPWLAGACAALALGFSPLAFALLGIALGAVFLVHRRVDRTVVVVAGTLAAAAVVQVLVLVLFPTDGRYPYNPFSLLGVLVVTGLTLPMALRTERTRVLGAFLGLWALVNVLAFVVSTPFGDNLSRLRYVLFPLVLLVVVLAQPRSRALAAAALLAALSHNIGPDLSALPKRVADAHAAKQAFWQPALEYVRARSQPGDRVEVVPTFGHWEAWYVPRAGLPLARGWYRQIDLADNPELYHRPLSPTAYRRWLRQNGIRWVLLPNVRLGPLGARREAQLLESRRAGLPLALRTRDWRVYEVPFAQPLLSGPGEARVERLDHGLVRGRVGAPGRYRLAVRFSSTWTATGAVCAVRAADGMTVVHAKRAGRFELAVAPLSQALRGAAARASRICGPQVSLGEGAGI